MSTLAFPATPVPCADFSPERMLLGAERRQAIDLIRRLRVARDTLRETQAAPRHERLVKRIAALANQLSKLSEAVWQREFALEQFTVLSVRPASRSEGPCFMVEDLTLDQWLSQGPLRWDFRGSKLRKDGLVGTLPVHVIFREAAIARRHLSGQWEALRLVMDKAA